MGDETKKDPTGDQNEPEKVVPPVLSARERAQKTSLENAKQMYEQNPDLPVPKEMMHIVAGGIRDVMHERSIELIEENREFLGVLGQSYATSLARPSQDPHIMETQYKCIILAMLWRTGKVNAADVEKEVVGFLKKSPIDPSIIHRAFNEVATLNFPPVSMTYKERAKDLLREKLRKYQKRLTKYEPDTFEGRDTRYALTIINALLELPTHSVDREALKEECRAAYPKDFDEAAFYERYILLFDYNDDPDSFE